MITGTVYTEVNSDSSVHLFMSLYCVLHCAQGARDGNMNQMLSLASSYSWAGGEDISIN